MKNRTVKLVLPIVIPVVVMAAVFIAIFGIPKKNSEMKPVPIRWGEDTCARCDMSIVDAYHAVEIINPTTKKVYKFDDIGCAVLWLYKEHKFKWAKKAVIWVTSAKNGAWIPAKSACWVSGQITPMGFGFGAYKEKPKQYKKCIPWKQLVKEIFAKEEKFEKALYGSYPQGGTSSSGKEK